MTFHQQIIKSRTQEKSGSNFVLPFLSFRTWPLRVVSWALRIFSWALRVASLSFRKDKAPTT